MVLENAISDKEEAFTSDDIPFPTSDFPPDATPPDATSSSPPNDVNVSIPFTKLPQPFFTTVPQTSINDMIAKSVNEHAAVIHSLLHRAPRQEEIDAIAFHAAKGIRLASFGVPVGFVISLVLARRGAKTYRFPFYNPMKKGRSFDPDRFPLPFGPGLSWGPARLSWQLCRFSAYSILGGLGGSLFFGSYAVTVNVVGKLQDPRLKEFMAKLKEVQLEGRKTREKGVGDAPGARVSAGTQETFEMARQRARAQEGTRQLGQGSARVVVDDASPTGGMFTDEFMGGSEQQMEEKQTSSTGQARTNPAQGGSKWERLRYEALSTGGQAQSKERGIRTDEAMAERGNDGFNLLSSGGERDVKSPEQREFDARIQRERDGRNFDERNGGGQRKW